MRPGRHGPMAAAAAGLAVAARIQDLGAGRRVNDTVDTNNLLVKIALPWYIQGVPKHVQRDS